MMIYVLTNGFDQARLLIDKIIEINPSLDIDEFRYVETAGTIACLRESDIIVVESSWKYRMDYMLLTLQLQRTPAKLVFGDYDV